MPDPRSQAFSSYTSLLLTLVNVVPSVSVCHSVIKNPRERKGGVISSGAAKAEKGRNASVTQPQMSKDSLSSCRDIYYLLVGRFSLLLTTSFHVSLEKWLPKSTAPDPFSSPSEN